MGFLFKSAKDLARQASVDANIAENTLRECVQRLSAIENDTRRIAEKMNEKTPRHAAVPLAKTLHQVRKNSEKTLIYLNRLRAQIARIKVE